MTSFSIRERMAAGKALRGRVPRASHASWQIKADRRDLIEILECSNRGRLPELIPIRYGRMLRNPFTFLRGAASLMARDLAATPSTGIDVQACGDCHVSNFGLFATPERNLIFDINDFDETLRAPWEWDVKRLAASFVVAARINGISDRRARETAVGCARSYREHLREFSTMSPLEVWYYRISAEDLIEQAPDPASKAQREYMAARARHRIGEHLLPKITEQDGGQHRFVERPPTFVRVSDAVLSDVVCDGIGLYRESLPEDRRYVFDRYRLEDLALRVVGVGSVGTRCYVGLFFCDDRNSLLLQIKEARQSVLEPYARKSPFENQGQRVVIGQRLIQSASDMFLGWLRARSGHDFYVRQLRDMKFSMPVESFAGLELERYAEVCGWTLARAHAKSGDAATICGYLGCSSNFEKAIGSFSLAYADQTEKDHAVLAEAARSGRIVATDEPL